MGCSLTNGTREMRIMITYNGENMCKDDGIVLESFLVILEFFLLLGIWYTEAGVWRSWCSCCIFFCV
jgi:hypothetical protein